MCYKEQLWREKPTRIFRDHLASGDFLRRSVYLLSSHSNVKMHTRHIKSTIPTKASHSKYKQLQHNICKVQGTKLTKKKIIRETVTLSSSLALDSCCYKPTHQALWHGEWGGCVSTFNHKKGQRDKWEKDQIVVNICCVPVHVCVWSGPLICPSVARWTWLAAILAHRHKVVVGVAAPDSVAK